MFDIQIKRTSENCIYSDIFALKLAILFKFDIGKCRYLHKSQVVPNPAKCLNCTSSRWRQKHKGKHKVFNRNKQNKFKVVLFCFHTSLNLSAKKEKKLILRLAKFIAHPIIVIFKRFKVIIERKLISLSTIKSFGHVKSTYSNNKPPLENQINF